jgi:dihydrofolate reductase
MVGGLRPDTADRRLPARRRDVPGLRGVLDRDPDPAGHSGLDHGKPPTAAEQEWARFTETTPHYVLSSTLQTATWPNTSFLRSIEEVVALKQQPGKDIYLIGGARITTSMIDAGLVDELRLITYPLIAGSGSDALFEGARRRGLGLRMVRQLDGGKVASTYRINP